MINNLPKAVISCIVAFALLLSVIVPVLALDIDHGTAQDGITGACADIYAMAANDNLLNYDFAEGLKYWGAYDYHKGDTAVIKAGDYATAKVDNDETTYVNLTSTTTGKYTGIISEPVKLEGVVAGDKIRLVAQCRNNGDATQMRMQLAEHKTDGTKLGSSDDQYKVIGAPSKDGTWHEVKSSYYTVENSESRFIVFLNFHGKITNIDYTDFSIVKQTANGDVIVAGKGYNPDENDEPDEPSSEHGTAEDGITGACADIYAMAANDNLLNYDFAEGLKYWGAYDYHKGDTAVIKAGDYATAKEDSDRTTYVNLTSTTTGKYTGIISEPVKLEGVVAGDKIKLVAQCRNNGSATQMRMQLAEHKTDGTKLGSSDDQYKVIGAPSNDGTWHEVKSSYYTVENSESRFIVFLNLHGQITNIDYTDFSIVKQTANGDVIVAGKGYNPDENDEPDEPSSEHGTKKDGIEGAPLDVYTMTANTDLKNYDFAEGLKYWGGYGKNDSTVVKAGDYATAKEDSDRTTYVNLTSTTQGQYTGIYSEPVKLKGVVAGDKIKLVAQCRNNGSATQMRMQLAEYKPDGTKLGSSDEPYKVINAPSSDGQWHEVKSAYYTVSNSESNIIVSLNLHGQITNIDYTDFSIVKRTANGDVVVAGKGYNPDEIDEPNNNFTGTEALGITAEGNATQWIITKDDIKTSLQNADFEQGLKYWGATQDYTLTDIASVVTDELDTTGQNHALKINVDATDEWGKGVISAPFTVKNVKEGDILNVKFKVRVGSNGQHVRFYLLQNTVNENSDSVDNSPIIVSEYTDSTSNHVYGTEWQDVTLTTRWKNNNPQLSDAAAGTVKNSSLGVPYFFIKIISGSGNASIYIDDIEIINTSYSEEDSKYGTYDEGIQGLEVLKSLPILDTAKNLDFSEGFKYWGSSATDEYPTAIGELIEEGDNTYFKLVPNPSLPTHGAWHGLISAYFYIKAKEGEKFTLIHNWKGDTTVQVRLRQAIGGEVNDLCGSHPAYGLMNVGETEDDFNTSYQYISGGAKTDPTLDGLIRCYIQIQINGVTDPLPTFSIDNIQIVRVEGEEGNYAFYDLEGNLLKFNFDDDTDDTEDTEDTEDTDDSEYDEDDDTDYSDSTGTVGSNTGTNNTTGSTGGSVNNGYTGFVNADSVDVSDAMEQINKLNAGEKVDFIKLFRLDSQKGKVDAYVSVGTLKEEELRALKSLNAEELENYAISLRAILSTLYNKPNVENAKAYVKFGGNASKTLPFCFTGNVNLPFTVNIRIKVNSSSLDVSKTYYGYLCDAYTREINNLGKVYLEEQDGNIYLTIRTNRFADFFITEDNLKPVNDAGTQTADGLGTGWLIAIICASTVLLIAAVLVVILVIKKKRIK